VDSNSSGVSAGSAGQSTATSPGSSATGAGTGSSNVGVGGTGEGAGTGSFQPEVGSATSGSSVSGSIPIPPPQPAPEPTQQPAADTSSSVTGNYNVIPLGPNSDVNLKRRETINVNLIWGVQPEETGENIWKVERNPQTKSSEAADGEISASTVDLAEPSVQEFLLETVRMARNDEKLYVQPDKLTWIEMLRDYAVDAGVGFPIPKDLFIGHMQLLKAKNKDFAEIVQNEVGTTSPGLAGDFTFASITIKADAVESETQSLSETVYRQWTRFAQKVNEQSPSSVPAVVAQSRIFLDAYRVDATIESTVTTWFVANGLCLLVILIFTQNVALSLMVMATIILIFFCLGGLLFAVFFIPFGPVEALGVSIFIGLSANYSLHVVHAYHHSKSDDRKDKVKEAMFAVGSPIVASALSTIGASAFLFGCRTWVFVELGILICSITTMALLYSMSFLFAWLAVSGPRPVEKHGRRLHRWDLQALWCWRLPGESNQNLDADGATASEVELSQAKSSRAMSPRGSNMSLTLMMADDELSGQESKNDNSDDESAYSIEVEEDEEDNDDDDMFIIVDNDDYVAAN
jgi:hypothetical protein